MKWVTGAIVIALTTTAYAQQGTGLNSGPGSGPEFGTQCHNYNRINTKTDSNIEGGWVVSIPAGSSDFFNVRYDNSSINDGINISVADFGASSTYPRIGLYAANLGLDPTGNTPDISSPFVEVFSPPLLGGPLFEHKSAHFSDVSVTAPYHAVVQFPPGDSGLLGVGADTDTNALGGSESPGSPNPADSSGFTTDGYSTPSVFPFASGDFSICPCEDPKLGGAINGILALNNGLPEQNGDHTTYTTQGGQPFGVAFFGPEFSGGPTLFLLFLSFLGAPIAPIGPILPTIPGGEGTAALRVGGTYPVGAGNITFNMVAISGAPGVPGSVGFSNEVTLHALPDISMPPFGCYDDGTYETGWVVSIPSGSSDYFNVNHGDAAAAGVTGINGQRIAVMDFGTSVSAYPSSGKTTENTGVDPTGNTPDLGNVYVTQPFPFPALTFCTTSGQMVASSFATFAPTTPNLHGIVQFPVGDSGLLGVGGDTNSTFISGLSGWTLDGYSTPSNLFGVNWGMCCDGF